MGAGLLEGGRRDEERPGRICGRPEGPEVSGGPGTRWCGGGGWGRVGQGEPWGSGDTAPGERSSVGIWGEREVAMRLRVLVAVE